jgi:hypothetical protein
MSASVSLFPASLFLDGSKTFDLTVSEIDPRRKNTFWLFTVKTPRL